jgi:hypothetical protein
MARGSRATKKICASTLSANGIVVLNTRENPSDVDPMKGDATTATTMAPKHAATTGTPRRMGDVIA